ncbi:MULTISPECIES: ABC transporter permease [unclassified Paenibacillus]|uniref:ABC transporter permease n=1 Tax=unclassified Paenibacillus TaxID=185978 RepID=UPI0030F5D768
MIKVKNKKVIRKLADKSYKTNKTRNLIAILAIALTSLLFTVLYTMGLGTVDSIQQTTLRQAGGGHAVLKHIDDEVFTKIKEHPLIKEIAYRRILSDGVLNNEFLKRQTEFWYYDDAALKLGFIKLAGGRKPVAENEVIADTQTLQLLGIPLKVGEPLTLQLDIRGKQVERRFNLSGWWKSDPMFNAGQIYASRAYLDAHHAELQNTYKKDKFYTGTIHPTIMFNNSLDLRGKLDKVIIESGYSLDEEAANYVESNVNWAYLAANFGNMDPGIIVALILMLLLIMFTGYLIIYNIFQISVIRDIRFYGLLKMIGTSGRQIRQIIHRQAMLLSVIGIPLGLIIGYIVGKSLVPLIINNTNLAGAEASVSPSPWIFILAALFTLITVFISTSKPGKAASSVSPVAATKYVDRIPGNKTMPLKSTRGVSMRSMARANLGRSRKRTLMVAISLSLSPVLLNTAFDLSQSIDTNKYLSSQFGDTDFLIGHADLFKQEFVGHENGTSESFIQAVQDQPGFEEGCRLYGDRNVFTVDKSKPAGDVNDGVDAYGNYIAQVFGLEELCMGYLQIMDGELDSGKLASGRYILEGVDLNDYGEPYWERTKYKVGEKVTLHKFMGNEEATMDRYKTFHFTVLGHVAMKEYSNSDSRAMSYNFYLPADIYKSLTRQRTVMSYAFNVSSNEEAGMEHFLKSYTKTTEPFMDYRSKFTVLNEVSGMQTTVKMIGGTLSLIIGLIGVLNFVNAILTSIITRQQELAMLQSIGMTKRQLRSMLAFEGFYYALGTSLLSTLLAIISSVFIVRPLSNTIWYCSYHFVIWPVLAVLPILFALGTLIPLAVYSSNSKRSIVEQLRLAE